MTGDDPRDIADRADELTALIPALAAALSRDNTPSDGRSVLSAGGVVNADVLHAMITLRAEIPAACSHACDLTGEPWNPRPLDVCLRALPRLRDRLAVLGQPADARRVEAAVERWMRVVKLALGLRVPDMSIGYDCPLHEEPSALVMIGSEGFLLAGKTIAVTWQHDGRICCRFCGEQWNVSQWPLLGRMLDGVLAGL
jgi:hypothetical protein